MKDIKIGTEILFFHPKYNKYEDGIIKEIMKDENGKEIYLVEYISNAISIDITITDEKCIIVKI